jgi:hypothetical protein
MLCCGVQAVGDGPVLQALSRASRADSISSSKGGDLAKELLQQFTDLKSAKGGRGGAEALFVLQVSGQHVEIWMWTQ